jgi:rubrerythrin
MHPTTRQNLMRALEREAVSAARLTAYANRAERDGDPGAAETLRAIARWDLGHAAEMIEELGWVGRVRDNVLASVVGDATVHGLNYATLAAEARNAGDRQAAELFRRLTADETEAALILLALASRNDPIPSAGAVDSARDRPGTPPHRESIARNARHAAATTAQPA